LRNGASELAKAVMIGRAYLWGLAANGQTSVENVLDILRNGIDATLLGLGHSSTTELNPDDLIIPNGFNRNLGVPNSHSRGDTPSAVVRTSS
jgi:pre-mycofactocin synthase